MSTSPDATAFILSAFDRDRWCPVLQRRFFVDDLDALAAILGARVEDDPEIRGDYVLGVSESRAISGRFGGALDVRGLACEAPDIFLFRPRSISTAPYLIHAGYELPLLLEGRKKLARMGGELYPPYEFMGEDRFDRWVAASALRKVVVDEPFDEPMDGYLGVRTVYYTPPGEEWRVPAMQLLDMASGRSGGWNEYFERLEGMLFGYTDEQNDWWNETGIAGGGFGGFAMCRALDPDGLDWLEAAGYRALPPAGTDDVTLWSCGPGEDIDRDAIFRQEATATVVVRFRPVVRHVMALIDLRAGSPWTLSGSQIPILNRHLRGSIDIVARREDVRTPASPSA